MPERAKNKPLSQEQRRIQAQNAKENWNALSAQLPDVPDVSMEEIVAEIKRVRAQNR